MPEPAHLEVVQSARIQALEAGVETAVEEGLDVTWRAFPHHTGREEW